MCQKRDRLYDLVKEHTHLSAQQRTSLEAQLKKLYDLAYGLVSKTLHHPDICTAM